MSNLKVGGTLWLFDENRRIYRKDAEGNKTLVYREHWKEHKITGETKRSWVLEYGEKVAKTGDRHLATLAEVEEAAWDHDNRPRIRAALFRTEGGEQSVSTQTLRQIAALIGYVEPEQPE